MEKLKIVFFGTPDFVIPVVDVLNANFKLQAVVTAPSDSAVSKYAEKLNIPVLKPQQFDNLTIQQLSTLTPDLFIVASYGKLVPQSILDLPKYGNLNIHPSKLPKFRGPSPIQNTILSGELTTAITIIKMDKELDHGPIVSQTDIEITNKDTFESLLNSLFAKSAEILLKVIPDFVSGKTIPQEQDHSQATFTNHITKEDGYFDIENPPDKEKLDKMIRAYYPWPACWTKWNNKIVKFLPEGKIQMEGKKPVPIKDFLNGYPNFPSIL